MTTNRPALRCHLPDDAARLLGSLLLHLVLATLRGFSCLSQRFLTSGANASDRFFVEETELGRGGKGVVLLVKHVLDGVSLGLFACKRVPVGRYLSGCSLSCPRR